MVVACFKLVAFSSSSKVEHSVSSSNTLRLWYTVAWISLFSISFIWPLQARSTCHVHSNFWVPGAKTVDHAL